MVGTLEDRRVAFLARHGMRHSISPTEVNYRANIFALKSLGATRIISVSACGSLREDYAPGDLVVPDQLFDYTKDRSRTFFGAGLVAHVSVEKPFCDHLSSQLETALRQTSKTVHHGGALITIEGPRFSTKVESNIFRSWGLSLIGMTTSPEAFLAREAEMCYAVMAHITDYDVWHASEAAVTAEMVIRTLNRNTQAAQEAIGVLARDLDPQRKCNCDHALADALITHPEAVPAATSQRLDLLVRKYLK